MSELPLYKCHKEVRAAKILSAEVAADATMRLGLDGSVVQYVSAEWVARKAPTAASGLLLTDGYYVVYEDGFASWSPAKAFEEGYTRVPA